MISILGLAFLTTVTEAYLVFSRNVKSGVLKLPKVSAVSKLNP